MLQQSRINQRMDYCWCWFVLCADFMSTRFIVALTNVNILFTSTVAVVHGIFLLLCLRKELILIVASTALNLSPRRPRTTRDHNIQRDDELIRFEFDNCYRCLNCTWDRREWFRAHRLAIVVGLVWAEGHPEVEWRGIEIVPRSEEWTRR